MDLDGAGVTGSQVLSNIPGEDGLVLFAELQAPVHPGAFFCRRPSRRPA